jgi:uncharacterized RDD family membrane protein YckC
MAFFIDSLVLSVPAFVAGTFLFDWFAALGQWGRLLGFAIALAYFGLLNSVVGNGQTIGKKCVRTRTVDAANQPISVGRSMLRFTVLGLPFFLNGAIFLQAAPLWASFVGGAIIFGLGGAIIYLLVCNRRNRRSVHDLVAGTRVIRTELAPPHAVRPIWKGHFVIFGALAVALISLGAVVINLFPRDTFTGLFAVQQTLLKQSHVAGVSIFDGASAFSSFGGGRTTTATFVAVNVQVSRRPDDYAELADQVAATTLATYPQAQSRSRIVVTLEYGYDIGIARMSTKQAFDFTPAEWRQRVELRRTPQV